MKFLMDTDKLIDFLHENDQTIEESKRVITGGVSLSVVSLAEYLHGVFVSKNPEKERSVLFALLKEANISVLDVTKEIAIQYSEIQGALSKRGLRGNGFDVIIAATALVHNLTLWTGNTKDFSKIEDLVLYKN